MKSMGSGNRIQGTGFRRQAREKKGVKKASISRIML
jgi:hypothetical protein